MFWITYCEITQEISYHTLANQVMDRVDNDIFAYECVGKEGLDDLI